MLSWLDESPSYFQYKLNNNSEERDSKSLENGKLLHLYIESPEDFTISEVVKPSDMLSKWAEEVLKLDKSATTEVIVQAHKNAGVYSNLKSESVIVNTFMKDAYQYYSYLRENKDKIALTKDQGIVITNCQQSLKLHEDANKLLFNYGAECEIFNELEIYFDFPIRKDYINKPEYIGQIVKCKGKLDKVIIDHELKTIIINDLKTTSENPYGEIHKVNNTKLFKLDYMGTGWFKSYIKYRYDRQCYFYIAAVIQHFKKKYKDYHVMFNFIVVKTKQPYNVAVYNISIKDQLAYAKADIERLLQSYMHCFITNRWTEPIGKEGIIEI